MLKKLLFVIFGIGLTALAAAAQEPVITPRGVGGLTLGMPYSSIPPRMDGLYNHVEILDNDDYEFVSFSAGETEMLVALGDGKIEQIDISANVASTADGVCVGMPRGDFLAKGWKKNADGLYEKEGITVYFDTDDAEGVISTISVGAFEM